MNVFDLVATISLDSSGFESGLSKLGSAAGTAIAGATTAVAGFTAASIKTGMGFDTAMSQVAATMGQTMDELNSDIKTTTVNGEEFTGNLTEFAEHMGATTQYTAQQSAEALNYMALAGYDVQTSMNMLPNVMNLAAAGAMDLATASDMVTDAQTALGLEIDDVNVMVDRMAKTASKSNTSVEQLGEAFLTVGANAKSMGSGMYDTTTEAAQVLGLLANNGIKASEAGTHLRNILLACNPTTDDAAAAWDQLGVSAYDADGNLRDLQFVFEDLSAAMEGMSTEERTDIITKMFNKTDLASVNALLDTTSDQWNELAEAIEGAWYTEASLDEQVQSSLNMSLDEMRSNLAALGMDTEQFDIDLQVCGGNAETFADALLECVDEGTTQQDVVNALGGDLDALQTAFDGATGAAQAMADTQLDNLQGDITILTSAFEGLQISVSDLTTGTLREFVQYASDSLSQITTAMQEGGPTAAIQTIADVLPQGIELIVSKVPSFLSAGIQLLEAVGSGILQSAPTLLSGIADVAAQLFTTVVEEAPKMLTAGAELIRSLAEGLSGNVTEMLNKALPMLVSFSEELRANAGELVSAGLELIIQLAQGIIDALPTIVQTVPVIIDNLVNIINDNMPKILNTGMQLIVMLAEGLIAAIPEVIKAMPKIIACIWDTITAVQWISLGSRIITAFEDGITAMIPNVKSAAGNIKQGIITAITELPSRTKALALEAIQGIVNTFKSINWVHVGREIIQGIANGITQYLHVIVDAAKNAAESAFNAAKNFLGIKSPSRLMRDEVGKYVSLGFAAGITDYSDSAVEAMEDTSKAVSDAATLSMNSDYSSAGSAGYGTTLGGVTINVYGVEGQSSQDIAERVADIINNQITRQRAVFA